MPNVIYGTIRDDVLNGTADDDLIAGYNGNDTITGNGGSDVLNGGDGNDRLIGNVGRDILIGGRGNDILVDSPGVRNGLDFFGAPDELYGGQGDDSYHVYLTGDTIIELFGEGYDIVFVHAGNFTLPDNVERLDHSADTNPLVGFGNGLDNVIDGGSASDYLVGGNGNDNITGRLGNDAIFGDDGNDSLSGDGGDDVVFGGNGNDTLLGSSGIDQLVGGDGNDSLDGGADADTLIGGLGDDIYYLQNDFGQYPDTIIEMANEGIDTLILQGTFLGSVPDFYIPLNFENLILQQSLADPNYSGPTRMAAFGNNGNNVIQGTEGYEELFGLDGNDMLLDQTREIYRGIEYQSVPDTLFGGSGNDTYVVNALGTSTIENVNSGIDTVVTSLHLYYLQPNIENLVFKNTLQSYLDGVFYGNDLANEITMLSGTYNEIYGYGGDDIFHVNYSWKIYGGTGNDTYYTTYGVLGIFENTNEGNDTVYTVDSVAYNNINIENLIYNGTSTFNAIGAENWGDFIQGGARNDALDGKSGDDILVGGSGADTLNGGTGADQFRYIGGETGFDKIVDFVSGTDKIALANSGFAHTATVDFVQGSAPTATSTNSTFLYNTADGMLSFDPDGSGAQAAVALAQLNAGQTLVAADLIFY